MGLLLRDRAADPAIGGGQAAIKRSDANVLFVVDTTGSMAAQDYDGGEPRLVGVRHDIAALADEFSGAHFALITFNSKTRVIVPWTTDRGGARLGDAAVAPGVDPVRPRHPPRRAAADDARRCSPGPEPVGGYDVVFFLSDGEQTTGPRRSRSISSATSSPAAPCSATARRRAPGCTSTSATTRSPSNTSPTTRPALTRSPDSTRPTSSGSPTSWASGMSTARQPDDVGEIAGAAADRAGRTYSGERDTRAPAVLAAGVRTRRPRAVAARPTALEIVDDRRMLGARTSQGPDVTEPEPPGHRRAATSSSVARAADRRRPPRRRREAGDDELVLDAAARRRTTTPVRAECRPHSTGCSCSTSSSRGVPISGRALPCYRPDDLDGAEAAFREPSSWRRSGATSASTSSSRSRPRATASSAVRRVRSTNQRCRTASSATRSPSTSPTADSARRRRPATQASASRKLAARLQDKLGLESSEPDEELSAPVQREAPDPVGEQGDARSSGSPNATRRAPPNARTSATSTPPRRRTRASPTGDAQSRRTVGVVRSR